MTGMNSFHLGMFAILSVYKAHYITEVNEGLKDISETIAAMKSRIEETRDLITDHAGKFSQIYNDVAFADKCEKGFDAVLDSLDNIQFKTSELSNIKSGIRDFGSSLTEVLAGNHSIVQVGVSNAYADCLNYWKVDINNDEAKLYCLRVALWQYVPETINERDRQRRSVEGSSEKRLDEIYMDQNNPSKPTTGYRIRREYRTLNYTELNDFHNALNLLHEKGTVAQFAKIHECHMEWKHRGNAFLPWHRVFIAFFEEALRNATGTVNPDMFLPYWDRTLDNYLDPDISPAASDLFSSDHFGQFDHWHLANPPRPLTRSIGISGSLMKQEKINGYLNTKSYALFRMKLEYDHNLVHEWIGGTMETDWSSLDPIFYMHHAFIDKTWQEFREIQIKKYGQNPAEDYFYDYKEEIPAGHAPNATMTEMRYLKNRDGMASYWVENSWYAYAPSPKCPDCGGNNLFCDTTLGVCKPYLRYKYTDTPESIRRTAKVHELKLQKLHDQYGKELIKVSNRSNPCDVYPYMSRCRRIHPVNRSISDIAKDMCAGVIPYSKSAGEIQALLDKEIAMAAKSPPMPGRKFFSELPLCPDRPYVCSRPPRAIVYDLLTHHERRGADLRWRKNNLRLFPRANRNRFQIQSL